MEGRDEPVASDLAEGDCPGSRCFQLLGKRWNAFIVWALLEEPRRFTDLLEMIDGVSDRMLTKRLRELEQAGVVSRRRYREIPPRVEYSLTDAGQALRPIIEAMEQWGSRWIDPMPAPAAEVQRDDNVDASWLARNDRRD
ncbi:MAG: winged helix-turn-helix transcriptional regulator [Acidimicrobiia bacterium]